MNLFLKSFLKPYSQRLPRAGLGNPNHVPAAQGHREALSLDRCRLFEILLHQHIHYILCQKEGEDKQPESDTAGP